MARTGPAWIVPNITAFDVELREALGSLEQYLASGALTSGGTGPQPDPATIMPEYQCWRTSDYTLTLNVWQAVIWQSQVATMPGIFALAAGNTEVHIYEPGTYIGIAQIHTYLTPNNPTTSYTIVRPQFAEGGGGWNNTTEALSTGYGEWRQFTAPFTFSTSAATPSTPARVKVDIYANTGTTTKISTEAGGTQRSLIRLVRVSGARGPTGAQGPQGPIGPQGPPGTGGGGGETGTLAYRHVQASAATTWTITHDLGFYPNITVVDSVAQEIFPGNVEYLTPTTVRLTFSSAVGGEAYLS